MTSLSLILSPLLAMQGAAETPVAIKNDDPETWTVSYPRPLFRYVDDYRRCLRIQMRSIEGVADFEMQHRSDLPRCGELREEMITQGYARLTQDSDFGDYGEAEVRMIFDNVDSIHVARGIDLDRQFSNAVRTAEATQKEFNEERERTGFVLELRDASVVKARTDATAAAAEAAYAARQQEIAQNEEEAVGAPD